MSRLNKLLKEKYNLTIKLFMIAVVLFAISLQDPLLNIVESSDSINYDAETKVLEFDSLTLKQKIAQMLITYSKDTNAVAFQKMFIGGIFVDAQKDKQSFINKINLFQKSSVIPLFVSTDMEGCRNPFENFQQFPTFAEINSNEESYQIAIEQGQLLQELGFNMNLAPVVDLEDTIWNCRSFNGNIEEISEKAEYYIKGLHEMKILSIAKHFPGKTLNIGDTHTGSAKATIENEDLLPFLATINSDVDGIMVSHMIVEGVIDSNSKPVMTSKEVIGQLKQSFNGLIVTDEIGMHALKEYYTNEVGFTDYKQMFIDLFKANNDIIITFDKNPKRIYNLINTISNAVENGEISENDIDNSVKKILYVKGIKVI